uniref:WD repeat-containing protein 55 homolog n=2 Tax=Caenorhabditis japonica TaxID=281687 RepID=A0A8R1I457_CAEJA
MTVKITTHDAYSERPWKAEAASPTPIAAEIMQHADVKISKVLFTRDSSSQIVLLGKGRGRCLKLWERDDGIDPFKVLSTQNCDVDPNDACTMTDNRVCIGYADGSLSIYNTDKDSLALMAIIPSVHSGCASRAVCRNGNGILSAGTNGTLEAVDVETGKSRSVFSGQAGIRSICTTFGGNVVMAGDANGQITAWDLREDTENSTALVLEPYKTLIPSKKALDAVTALCSHPAQSNLVCCGTDDGVVGLIDARNIRSANITSTYLIAKRGISQVAFHPTCGDSLLVSSNDGSLLRIDASGAPM